MLNWILFLAGTILLLVFTLRRSHRHRFYRFLAFECLLALVILNSKFWFQDPFSIKQVLSWCFLFGSVILAVYGVILLTNLGDPAGDFENTRNLVFTGLYRWIRHPLYASLLLFGMGAVLKNISTASLALFIGAAVFVYATARVEENENLEKFGDEYREYSKKTKMFIPYLF